MSAGRLTAEPAGTNCKAAEVSAFKQFIQNRLVGQQVSAIESAGIMTRTDGAYLRHQTWSI